LTTPPPLADAAISTTSAGDGRPEFLVRLGLLIPCSVEDVEAAYRDAAKQAHPDHGGTVAEFVQLQSDYQAAIEYARLTTNRRGWLAENVERYAAQQDVIAEIERRGGVVETSRPEWISREVGEDFAQIVDAISAIRWTGPEVTPADIRYLVSQREHVGSLHRLDLSDTLLDYRTIRLLAALPTLHELNLHGTYAGSRTAAALAELPALRRVDLGDTFVNRYDIWRLRGRRPTLEIVSQYDNTRRPSAAKRAYRWLMRLLVVYVFGLVLATHYPPDPDIIPEVRWRGMDKVVHFGIYCGLTSLTAFALSWRSKNRTSRTGLSAKWYVAIAVFVAAFAAVDEFTQPLTGRDRDLKDWLADMGGMLFGLILFSVVAPYLRARRLAWRSQSPAGTR
jgi:VanZ family protein